MEQLNEVAEKIAREIGATGPISFARFMRWALYCPVFGYYERGEDTLGRKGDFYTSVQTGSLFGELLAFQFSKWLDDINRPTASHPRLVTREQVERNQVATNDMVQPGPLRTEDGSRSDAEAVPAESLRLVEAGAHGGELAQDILGWLQRWRPDLFAQVEYWIIEPSPRHQEWQQSRLAAFAGSVRWAPDFSPLAPGVRGIIFANELLDAMPVERWGWDAIQRTWFEWGVAFEHDRFVWTKLANDAGPKISLSRDLLAVLPAGFVVELCPEAERWWQAAASALVCGRLLTIDYGLSEEERFAPERPSGTLRAYHRHQASEDVLAQPGHQDITAHVNFPAIIAAGTARGLGTEAFITQEQFLTCVAAKIWRQPAGFGEWTPQHIRQFQTLTHPQHLGRPFRVLVQARGV